MKNHKITTLIVSIMAVLLYIVITDLSEMGENNTTKDYRQDMLISPIPQKNLVNHLQSKKVFNGGKKALSDKIREASNKGTDTRSADFFTQTKFKSARIGDDELIKSSAELYNQGMMNNGKSIRHYAVYNISSKESENYSGLIAGNDVKRKNYSNNNLSSVGSTYADNNTHGNTMQKAINDLGGGGDDDFGGGGGIDNGGGYNDVPVGNGTLSLLFIASIYIIVIGLRIQKSRKQSLEKKLQ